MILLYPCDPKTLQRFRRSHSNPEDNPVVCAWVAMPQYLQNRDPHVHLPQSGAQRFQFTRRKQHQSTFPNSLDDGSPFKPSPRGSNPLNLVFPFCRCTITYPDGSCELRLSGSNVT